MYHINEIFYSLQGEGYWTGTPAVFVRFSGCNLRCPWCDTDYSASTPMSAEQICEAVRDLLPDTEGAIVVLTGGEPTLQVDTALCQALHAMGLRLHMETNGTSDKWQVASGKWQVASGKLQPETCNLQLGTGIDWVTCSPKEYGELLLTEADEVKIVYTGQDVEAIRARIRAPHYFLQPCSGQNTDEVINYIKAHPHWRLSLQTHKMLQIR